MDMFPTCLTGVEDDRIATTDRLAQLAENRTAVREVAGSNLSQTNTHGL